MRNGLKSVVIATGLAGLVLGGCSGRTLTHNQKISEISSQRSYFNFPEFETFSLKYDNLNMTIPVVINRDTARLIFDTGVPEISVIDSAFAERIGLGKENSIGYQMGLGEGDEKIKGHIYVVGKLKLGNIELENVPFVIKPWPQDGSLGRNILGKLNWKINFRNDSITFYEKDKQIFYSGDTISIPIRENKGYLLMDASLDGGKTFMPWFFDTGYKGICLNTQTNDSASLEKYGCNQFSFKTTSGINYTHFCKEIPEISFSAGNSSHVLRFGRAANFSTFDTHFGEKIKGQLGISVFDKNFSSLTYTGNKIILEK